MKSALGLSALGLVSLMLSGCDWVGMFAKEAVVGAISHRGWDTVTFKGQLPAEFGIDVIALYGANEPDKASCQAQTYEPGKTMTRHYGKRYTAEIQSAPQAFSFDIPLSYYQGLCGMTLGRIKLEIKIRYGKEKWQKTYGNGNFYIEHPAAVDSASFTDEGTLDISAVCSLMFQESRLHFGIAKLMSCRGAGASLPKADLANKTVNLSVAVSPEETPSMKNRWISTEIGWKPCQPTEKSNRCQTPSTFKTFQMNGQTCTVYPSCKEQ